MSGLSLVGRPVVGFSCCVPAPSVECVVDQHSRFKLFEIVIVHAGQPERRRQQARRFRREFSRPVSAARTMIARRSRGGVERPNSSIMTSNVHSSPRWLQNTSCRWQHNSASGIRSSSRGSSNAAVMDPPPKKASAIATSLSVPVSSPRTMTTVLTITIAPAATTERLRASSPLKRGVAR